MPVSTLLDYRKTVTPTIRKTLMSHPSSVQSRSGMTLPWFLEPMILWRRMCQLIFGISYKAAGDQRYSFPPLSRQAAAAPFKVLHE